MSRHTNKTKSHPISRRPRQRRLIADLRAEPDVERIAHTLIAMATRSIDAEPEKHKQPDPFICDCLCNCCKLRRLHEGLCPQPSDEQLEQAAATISKTK